MHKLVYVSSTSAIPERPKGQWIFETRTFSPDTIVGYYGQTKAMATQRVMDAVKNEQLDASIVFPSGICGPNDFAYGMVAQFLMEYINKGMPAGIAGSFNAVDVRDLAAGTIACAQHGKPGEGYIMSNEEVSMREMFQLISRYSGAPEVKTILPASVGRGMGVLCEWVSKITRKPAQLTSFSVYNLTRNNAFSCAQARRELRFHTRAFEDTIRDSVLWLAKDGKIKPLSGGATGDATPRAVSH